MSSKTTCRCKQDPLNLLPSQLWDGTCHLRYARTRVGREEARANRKWLLPRLRRIWAAASATHSNNSQSFNLGTAPRSALRTSRATPIYSKYRLLKVRTWRDLLWKRWVVLGPWILRQNMATSVYVRVILARLGSWNPKSPKNTRIVRPWVDPTSQS